MLDLVITVYFVLLLLSIGVSVGILYTNHVHSFRRMTEALCELKHDIMSCEAENARLKSKLRRYKKAVDYIKEQCGGKDYEKTDCNRNVCVNIADECDGFIPIHSNADGDMDSRRKFSEHVF